MPEIALNPPPFNPHGEKGEFGLQEAQNEKRNARASQKTYPCKHPPCPLSTHKGRRGSLGVLMADTGDGTQGLAKTSTPVSIPPTPFSHTGRRGSMGVLKPRTGDGTQGLAKTSTPVSIPPAPFSHTGRRGNLGVLMAETGK